MKLYQEQLSQLFKNFVKNADVRNDVLKWIGDCLSENRGKSKKKVRRQNLCLFFYCRQK